MILGIGTDITVISRIHSVFNDAGDVFLNRLLTDAEKAIFMEKKDGIKFLAGRWAAKEAFAKALGTGIGSVVGHRDVEVLNNDLGAPYLNYSGKLKNTLEQRGIKNALISISHDGDYAVATVVLEN